MTRSITFLSLAIALQAAPVWSAPSVEAAGNWPQWRGPLANGVAPQANPPSKWSETENIKWKQPIPGFGTSTPIIWGDRVFLLSAVPLAAEAPPPSPAAGDGPGRRSAGAKSPHKFVVLCLERSTGKVRWEKAAVEETPHEGHHPDHGYASASPITDGELVLAYFGSRGLHCYDLQGNHKWSKDFGDMRTRNSFGEGASPALHGDKVVVVWDDETENDFIVALDRRTGKELWKTARSEATGWATPLIVPYEGKHQVVANATGKVRSYDLADGKLIWECAGQTANAIPSPVASTDTAYITSGFRGSALVAVALSAKGDVTGTEAVRWSRSKNTPYVPSPLLINDRLYVMTGNNGVITCVNARNGEPHFEAQKLEGLSGVYASPVSAAGRVYVLGRNGQCAVLKEGENFELLASNKLDDRSDATPALVGNEIFIRGHKNIYCIAER